MEPKREERAHELKGENNDQIQHQHRKKYSFRHESAYLPTFYRNNKKLFKQMEDIIINTIPNTQNRQKHSDDLLSATEIRKQPQHYDTYLMKNKLKQAIEQVTIRIKIGGQCRESEIENQQIIAGPMIKSPIDTGRYKYLPNSSLTKRISS